MSQSGIFFLNQFNMGEEDIFVSLSTVSCLNGPFVKTSVIVQ